MTEEEIIISNMLIHGHNPEISLLAIDDDLVDFAVMLATNDEYSKSDFREIVKKPKLVFKETEVFLRSKFSIHKIAYADLDLLKSKLHGKIVESEDQFLELYNNIGKMISPFSLPIKLVSQPYCYGNLSLLTNWSDDPEFLKKMKLYFRYIELGRRTSDMTGISYAHEIIHTQLESNKGIVQDYYNSEVLTIFVELLYAYDKGPVFLREALKNRINMFLLEFNGLYNFVKKGEGDSLWDCFVSSKYIVSTVKAIHLFNNYYVGDTIEKNGVLWMIQKVLNGEVTLEEVLDEYGINYKDSLDEKHVLSLIHSTKIS